VIWFDSAVLKRYSVRSLNGEGKKKEEFNVGGKYGWQSDRWHAEYIGHCWHRQDGRADVSRGRRRSGDASPTSRRCHDVCDLSWLLPSTSRRGFRPVLTRLFSSTPFLRTQARAGSGRARFLHRGVRLVER
jgi:hypothetical protein